MDLWTKQDKLKVTEIISTPKTEKALPLPTFTSKPEDYGRPKDAMELHTIQNILNFKFDPPRKDTNTPAL